MHVLAFSTVPTLPAGTGVVEVITEPAAHISEALATWPTPVSPSPARR